MTVPGGDAPYLSVVAASRNDDHGGDLIHRMQVFVDALAAQARRHRLPCELVLVEWNPPPDRPPLRDVLHWPDHAGFCPVRILTVPPELHRRYACADRLPLFQMIAKNVGIRRARAPFVLATNIDVLLSDPLFAWLAERPLASGCVYRADRIDVDRGVPLGEIGEQLGWCEGHVLRANRADGLRLAPADGSAHRVDDAVLRPDPPSTWAGAPKPPRRHRASAAFQRTRFGAWLRRSPLWPVLRAPWRAGVLIPAAAIELGLGFARTPGLAGRARIDALLHPWDSLPRLHTMACGDFLLMASGDWERLRGHPELEMFSLHLDSLALYAAHTRGIREVCLPEDRVLYHIEHRGGWTPDGDAALYARMRARGVPILTATSLARRIAALQRDPDLAFADADWGLARERLAEEVMVRSAGSPYRGARRHVG